MKTFLDENGKFLDGTVEKETVRKFLESFIYYYRITKSKSETDNEKINSFLKEYGLNPIIQFTRFDGINPRTINCSCDNPECEIGISFDESIMRFHDKYCIEHNIELDKKNIEKIINGLKEN